MFGYRPFPKESRAGDKASDIRVSDPLTALLEYRMKNLLVCLGATTTTTTMWFTLLAARIRDAENLSRNAAISSRRRFNGNMR